MHAKGYATTSILYNTVQGTQEILSICYGMILLSNIDLYRINYWLKKKRFIQNKLGVICFLKNSAIVLYISHYWK